MKKLIISVLLIFLTYCVFSTVNHVNSSINGTRINGYYMVEDFNGTPSPTLTSSKPANLTATIDSYPANSTPSAKVVSSGFGGNVYFSISVTLPVGKVVADYDSLFFDLYIGNVSNKQLMIYLNGTYVHKVSNNYLNGTNVNKGIQKIAFSTLNQTGAATALSAAGNTFTLGFGNDQGTATYYIDNIKFSGGGEDPVPVNTYKVTLNPGTGTCAYQSLTEAEEGAGLTLPGALPSARCSVTGYYFAGWAGSNVNETNVGPAMLPAGFWAIPHDTTLYAVYTNGTVYNTNPTCNVSLNGTVTGGFLMVEDFENKDVNDLLSLVAPYPVNANSIAKVVINPTNAEEHVALAVTKNWDEYLSVSVTLPEGKTLTDYEKLDFDLLYNSISGTDNGYKDFLIRFDAVPGQSSYFYKESTGGTGSHNTWIHRSIDLSGASGGNTFTLNMGIRGNNTNYMVDNIRLKQKPVTATYTVTFNPGAGTCATSSITESASSSGVVLPSTATPSADAVSAGWLFYGWSIVAVNSTTVAPSVFTPSGTYFPLTNITLYAVYTNSSKYDSYPTTATSANGTVTSRLLMVEDFETRVVGAGLNIFNTGGNPVVGAAKVSVNPSNLNERAVHVTTTNYENILQLSVTLPEGKTIANYEQLLFDFYWMTGDWKKMNVYVDGVKIHEDASYINQAPINTWTTKTYNINAGSANELVLALGISTDAGNYYIDNVKLKESISTVVDGTVENVFSVEGNQIRLRDLGNIMVMDLNGRTLINSNNIKVIDLNMLNAGIYIVKAFVDGNSVFGKIIIR